MRVNYDESVIVASAIDNPANYAPSPSGTIANAPELSATEASGVFYGQSVVDMVGAYTVHIHASNIAPLTAGEVLSGTFRGTTQEITERQLNASNYGALPITAEEFLSSTAREAYIIAHGVPTEVR